MVSGYRVPSESGHLTSYHAVGRAVDLEIDGVADRDIYNYARTLDNLGVGAYPLGHHTHIDVRSRRSTWVDLSRYGEPAVYVSAPEQWMLAHPDAGRSARNGSSLRSAPRPRKAPPGRP
jgi:hypothetical protein